MFSRFFSALVLSCSLVACSTAEEAAGEVSDVADDIPAATVDAVEAAGDVVEAGADVVTDAAGSAYSTVADVFRDDDAAAAAVLVRPTTASGANAQGTVRFRETSGGLRVMVSLRGLAPGMHGVHIHENASCAPGPDGKPAAAAGGHWDPHNTGEHGEPSDDPMSDKHLGDLGNVTADAGGTAQATFTIGAYNPDEHNVAGHALIVHSGMDDGETDPGGESGTRMGCGIIEAR